ncbi:MAG: alpha/beta hydrolase [Caldilineaceae bacterium]
MSTKHNRTASNGHVVAVDGMDIYYEMVGDGPPLLLLHNFFGSSQVWAQPFKERLAQTYRLVIPDLRGHGRSSNPSQTFTHRQVTQDLFALLDYLSIAQYRAIGVSSGAMALLHMATQQPERVETLVLSSGTSYFPELCRERQRWNTPENVPPERWQLLRERHPRGDEQIHNLLRLFQEMAETYEDMTFTPPHLATITAPTLIIHGDRDPFFPVNIPVEMYQAMPHSYLWIVPNALHLDPVGGYVDTQMQTRSALFKEYFTETVFEFLEQGWMP